MSWAALGGKAKQQAVEKDAGLASTLTVARLCCGSMSSAHK